MPEEVSADDDESMRPGSLAAAELRAMPVRRRQALRIPDDAAKMWDAVVMLARAIVDDKSGEPLMDRVGQVMERVTKEFTEQQILAFLEGVERQVAEASKAQQVPDWVRQLSRQGFVAFAQRVLGAGAYRKLSVALNDDIAVVCDALRRVTGFCMPYALAFQDVFAQTADAGQIADSLVDPANSIIGLITRVDLALGRIGDAADRKQLTADLLTDFHAPTGDELHSVVRVVRTNLQSKTGAVAEHLGERINRKFRGARQALATSPDPVSQSANSAIELIDRLLRSAFTDQEVLDWPEANYDRYDTNPDLTYARDGKIRPTTRAKCLCFFHAGMPPSDETALNGMLAEVVVSVRRSLQILKHSDDGTPEELDRLTELIYAIEAVLLFSVNIMWRSLPDEVVERLRDRIDGPVAPATIERSA